MKIRSFSIVAALAIVLAGVAVTTLGVASRGSVRALEPAGRKVVNVSVEPVRSAVVEDHFTISGTLIPWKEALLSAEASGKIEQLALESGDRVVAGQDLVIIDRDRTMVHLKSARARYQLAEMELARQQEMRDKGIASAQDFERVVVERNAALAEVETLEIELQSRVIRAPFDGIVDRVFPNENEFASVGSPLVSLIQVDRLKMVVAIPDQDVSYFSLGDPVSIRLHSRQGTQIDGTIHLIAARAGTATHTFETEIALDNSANELKPGMIASAVLVRSRYPDSPTIPAFSVISDGDSHHVFVEQDGIAVKRSVTVGLYQSDVAVLTEGLEDGDRLIVSGHRNLVDGSLVVVKGG